MNITRLQIFDVSDVSPTVNLPCVISNVCPEVYTPHLAGCDASTNACICQRGYELQDGACQDVDECVLGLDDCPVRTFCSNEFGSYSCHCLRGFYVDDANCLQCSRSCPEGSRETRPCDEISDRVCTDCTACDETSYEVKACDTTSDRKCFPATHLSGDELKEDAIVPAAYEGLSVVTSSNVVAENLHSTRNLETTYYVTDLTQASDFLWDRESGLQVNIGIHDVHLIPEYVDVDRESDNSYMLSNPNNSEDKAKFQHILRNFCRNPVPDYYSITLEISRDRTTTAQMVTCNSKDASVTKCPPSYSDGDLFLYRDLNEACQKMGTFPELLRSAANSIVCTQRTDLLDRLFNQSYSAEKAIRFPTGNCRSAISRCEQCLNQLRCVVLDLFERRCCQMECYTLMDCKLAHSEECTNVPVECAMGDAYRFTIQPVFHGMRSEVQCHLLRRPQTVIYELFFFVQLPQRGFQTPKVHRTIRSTDLAYHSRGRYTADFLTVEHDTGLRLHDRLLLRRQELRHRMNYTIHADRKQEEEEEESDHHATGSDDVRQPTSPPPPQRIPIHEISHNIYVASTQFENPFDFSTSSWIQENGCHKNISKMRPVKQQQQQQQQQRRDEERDDAQEVSVVVQTSSEPFTYFLKSVNTAPYIRFTVPGNMSILPYYFRHDSPLLLTDDSLDVQLNQTDSGDAWQIHVHGEMTSCPGYLGIIINDLLSSEELFRYDLLILCPSFFNLTFRIPVSLDRSDAAFRVRFTDPHKSYDVILTHATLGDDDVDDDDGDLVVENVAGLEMVPTSGTNLRTGNGDNSTLVNVSIALFVGLSFCFAASYIYLAKRKLSSMGNREGYGCQCTGKFQSTEKFQSTLPPMSTLPPSGKFLVYRAKPGPPRAVLCVYVVLWSVYSLSFTVTIFFYLLTFALRPEVEQLSRLSDFEACRTNVTDGVTAAMDLFRTQRILSQERLVGEMQRACTNHVGHLYNRTATEIIGILLRRNGGADDASNRDRHPLSHVLERRFNARLDSYRTRVSNYSREFRERVAGDVQRSMRHYRKVLESIHRTGWLSFAQWVFNESNGYDGGGGGEGPSFLEKRFETLLSGDEVAFGMFLEVEEIEVVQMWWMQLWERYYSRIPQMTDLPDDVSKRDPGGDLHCSTVSQPSSSSSTIHDSSAPTPPVLHSFDSTRYLVSLQHRDHSIVSTPPKLSSTYIVAEERRKPTAGGLSSVFDSSSRSEDSTSFHFQEILDAWTMDFLQVVFLVVDAVLLLYRISSIYVACNELSRVETRDRPTGPPLALNGGGCASSAAAVALKGCLRHRSQDVKGLSDGTGQELIRQLIFSDGQDIPVSSSEEADYHLDSRLTRITEYDISPRSPARGPPTPICNHPILLRGSSPVPGDHLPGDQSGYPALKPVLVHISQSVALPRIVASVLSILLVFLCARYALEVLDVSRLRDWSLLASYVGVVELRVNETNEYLDQHAEHLNNVILRDCDGQSRMELLNLHSLIEHFRIENLVADVTLPSEESCGFQRQRGVGYHHHGNWTCSASSSSTISLLDISLIPCNFLPVLPQLYAEFYADLFERDLVDLILPYVTAAQRLVVKATCAVTMAAAGVLLVHIASFLLFLRIETSRGRSGPTSGTGSSGSAPPSKGGEGAASNVLRPRLDSEEDENDSCSDSYRTFHCRHLQPGLLPLKSFLPELKYIETKV